MEAIICLKKSLFLGTEYYLCIIFIHNPYKIMFAMLVHTFIPGVRNW